MPHIFLNKRSQLSDILERAARLTNAEDDLEFLLYAEDQVNVR